jgi:tetratricopeptide (TPR) repeat protein
MSVADDLYADGAECYAARNFPAAENAFRRLMQVVPESSGRHYGRAAYSLGLALIAQDRTDEAKEALRAALRAEPTLQRARDRLDELSRRPPTPSTPGGMVGVARQVRMGSEPDPWFGQQRNASLRFRLTRQGNDSLPASPTIELRGQRIEGSVEDGDIIEVPGPWRPGDRPGFVLNHTTGEAVRADKSASRIAQWVILIGFLVAFAAFATFVVSNMVGGR